MSARPLRTTRARRLSPLGAALVAIALGGCASIERAPEPSAGDVAAEDVLERAPAVIDGLRVIGTYTAASGRLCRRLATPDGTVIARTSCRGADGRWTLGRRLSRPAPLAAPPLDTALPDTSALEPDADAGTEPSVPVAIVPATR